MRISPRIKTFIAEGAHSFFPTIKPLVELYQKETGAGFLPGHIGEPGENPNPLVCRRLAQLAIDHQNFPKAHHYQPIPGELETREVMASHFMRRKFFKKLDPEQIIITVSGKMALNIPSLLLINKGDKCAVFGPSYPGHLAGPAMAGGRLVRLPVREENDWSPDPQETEAILKKEKPKFLILCDPQNPTGGILSKEAREVIVNYVEKSGAIIFEDTIYHDHSYSAGYQPLSSYPEIEEQVFIIDGISKNQAATGWRLGILILPSRIYKKILPHILTIQNTFYSCPPTPLVEAIAPAYQKEGDEWIFKNCDNYRQRRNIIVQGANELPGVVCQKPGGAFYTMWNIRKTGMKADEFARITARYAGVSVLPARFFGRDVKDYHGQSMFPQADDYVRYSYVGKLANQIKAMARLKKLFKQKKPYHCVV